MAGKRRSFSSAFKAKVALEAIREQRTIAELAQRHKLHATQINLWKKLLSIGSWPPHCGRETSWSWTISPVTRMRVFWKKSKPLVLRSDSFRHTHLTSIHRTNLLQNQSIPTKSGFANRKKTSKRNRKSHWNRDYKRLH